MQEINARLKASKLRTAVVQRGGRLSLVATLPLRDDPGRRKQQRIALGLDATLEGFAQAERKAIELGFQLRSGAFTWESWEAPAPAAALTVEDFHAAARRLHATKYRGSPERGANAWSKKWAPALRKLPPSGPITEAVLLRIIRRLPEGTASRRDQGNLLAQVARSLGLPHEGLLAACRGYGAARLTERDIPTDAQIEAAWSAIRLPHWRGAWGMCAAFGLRPHELAGLTWLEGPWIRVADATKTGTRQVTACPSRWIEAFDLRMTPLPSQPPHGMAKPFLDALDRDGIRWRPYSLRHAYALRLLEQGIDPHLGARLMGHSLTTHLSCYQRWIEADRIQRALAGVNL